MTLARRAPLTLVSAYSWFWRLLKQHLRDQTTRTGEPIAPRSLWQVEDAGARFTSEAAPAAPANRRSRRRIDSCRLPRSAGIDTCAFCYRRVRPMLCRELSLCSMRLADISISTVWVSTRWRCYWAVHRWKRLRRHGWRCRGRLRRGRRQRAKERTNRPIDALMALLNAQGAVAEIHTQGLRNRMRVAVCSQRATCPIASDKPRSDTSAPQRSTVEESGEVNRKCHVAPGRESTSANRGAEHNQAGCRNCKTLYRNTRMLSAHTSEPKPKTNASSARVP